MSRRSLYRFCLKRTAAVLVGGENSWVRTSFAVWVVLLSLGDVLFLGYHGPAQSIPSPAEGRPGRTTGDKGEKIATFMGRRHQSIGGKGEG